MSSGFMKFANVVILIVNLFLLAFNYPWKVGTNRLDLSKFTLVFEDEFDGNSLNSSIWGAHSVGVRRGSYWSMGQVSVGGGKLAISTEYKPDGEFGAGYYTAGLDTRGRFEQAFGYYECRCILPKGFGLWSAFWLTCPSVSKVTGTAETGAEIDVFESPFYYRGGERANLITSNLHYNGYELQTRYKNVGIFEVNNPYEEYNTYGVAWYKDRYVFYINGVETATTSYGGVSQVPEYMLLSVEVDGVDAEPVLGWSGKIDRNAENEITDFLVDYVRVYQFNEYL